ncbi:MAG: hypothetical protein Q8L05_05765 [Actinomycetota bacterium]|nr:hypothetical protein [Actinomycetota bacterium]MDP2289406.1 hypothetical protein [Actinomycetota bacterium]
MLGWVEDDADGRSVLMRSGLGRIASLLPVGSGDEHEEHLFHTVVIEVEPTPGRPRSVRLSTKARVIEGAALHREAQAGLADQEKRAWLIAWHRHSWVPVEVPITSLDLQSDTQAWLVSLEQVRTDVEDASNFQGAGGQGYE